MAAVWRGGGRRVGGATASRTEPRQKLQLERGGGGRGNGGRTGRELPDVLAVVQYLHRGGVAPACSAHHTRSGGAGDDARAAYDARSPPLTGRTAGAQNTSRFDFFHKNYAPANLSRVAASPELRSGGGRAAAATQQEESRRCHLIKGPWPDVHLQAARGGRTATTQRRLAP